MPSLVHKNGIRKGYSKTQSTLALDSLLRSYVAPTVKASLISLFIFHGFSMMPFIQYLM